MERIRNSLMAKVSIWIFTALTGCILILYAATSAYLTHQYQGFAAQQITQDAVDLAQQLDGLSYESAAEHLQRFCTEYKVTAVLELDHQRDTFGASISDTASCYSLSMDVALAGQSAPALLTVIASMSTMEDIARVFVRSAPAVIALSALISAFSAWLCSRFIVAPVLCISAASHRMAQMDLSWRCPIHRSDELGALSDHLNAMAEQLSQTLGDLQAANARLSREIERVNALEAQRRLFFAAASHELKTPLTILKGQLESMILGIGRYRQVQAVLPEALSEAENMERLVLEILSLSRMEAVPPGKRPFCADEQLRHALKALLPLAEKRQIVVHTAIEPTELRGDAAQLGRAFENILSNAIVHSPPGAEVSVALTPARLTVRNSGVTLPEEALPKLFDPFYRVDASRNRETGGSGLGLYIVKTILEQHGLFYALQNDGDGVCFTIDLTLNSNPIHI